MLSLRFCVFCLFMSLCVLVFVHPCVCSRVACLFVRVRVCAFFMAAWVSAILFCALGDVYWCVFLYAFLCLVASVYLVCVFVFGVRVCVFVRLGPR